MKQIQNEKEYITFHQLTSYLHKVDITQELLTEESRLVFFINIYNALLLHAHIALGIPPKKEESRIIWEYNASYLIGPFKKPFNLIELEHIFIRTKLNYPPFLRDYITNYNSDIDELRNSLRSKNTDPRRNFVCFKFTEDSPNLLVFTEKNLNQMLEFNCSDFLRKFLHITKTEVSMPLFMKWCWTAIADNHQEFFNWLSRYLSSNQSQEIQHFAQLHKLPLKHVTFYDLSLQFFPKSIFHRVTPFVPQ